MHVSKDLMWRVLYEKFWELNGARIRSRTVSQVAWCGHGGCLRCRRPWPVQLLPFLNISHCFQWIWKFEQIHLFRNISFGTMFQNIYQRPTHFFKIILKNFEGHNNNKCFSTVKNVQNISRVRKFSFLIWIFETFYIILIYLNCIVSV